MKNKGSIPPVSPELIRLAQLGLLETKERDDDDVLDVKSVLEEIGKKQNERFSGLERQFNLRIDDIEMRFNRMGLSHSGNDKPSTKVWDKFLRAGIETKDMSVGSDPDGGYSVPEEWSARIVKTVLQTSPMRQVARVETVSTSALDVLVDKDDTGSGWVGEMSSRTDTTTAQLAKLHIPCHEIYAAPKVTQKLLDDSRLDIENWIAEKIASRFARKENLAFVSGDGVTQPTGFLSHTAIDNASYARGSLGYIASGAAGAFAASNPADKLQLLKYSLKAEYRADAVWLMNSDTAAQVAIFKDSTGRYIWSEAVSKGEPPMLFGSPVVFAEDMPAIAANSYSIAYGNFKEGYTIVDRFGIRMMRDPYTAPPYVKLYSTKRTGGDVTNYEAIKLMKFAAS
ncbi:MAG: phage major capsid protein [Micropepsaceae bacterium]